jgi:hypothetical protein
MINTIHYKILSGKAEDKDWHQKAIKIIHCHFLLPVERNPKIKSIKKLKNLMQLEKRKVSGKKKSKK